MVCLRYAKDNQEAEDFLQDSFVMIFRDLYQFDPEKGKLITWMRRVTINTILQHLRKRKLRFVELNNHTTASAYSEFNPDMDLRTEDILKQIRQLPEGYRTIFNFYEIEGYSHAEIAEMLEISEATSRSQLFKARRLLREKLTHASTFNNLNHVRK